MVDNVIYQSQTFVAPPIYNKAVVAGRIPESRVEYIPYEVREMVYDTIEKAEMIPIQKTITEYEQLRHTEVIPIEKAVTDFVAVEYVTEFLPQNYTERVVDYVQQETINEVVSYVPVERYKFVYSVNASSLLHHSGTVPLVLLPLELDSPDPLLSLLLLPLELDSPDPVLSLPLLPLELD